ncbi:MAG: glycosyltransferase [Nitrospinae bacterium]|nr:glycosyltransferase [Nitrospinota bacterium]
MPKVAIVHDWLTGMRGGERCLEVFCEIFPKADLFTLLHVKGSVSRTIEEMRVKTSALQRLPFAEKKYRYYLPLMPRLIEKFDLSTYDLVLSSSHCAAKGARPGPNTSHICYCYSPMRYIWDLHDSYFGKEGMGALEGLAMSLFMGYLRNWDRRTAKSVDKFIAISRFVAERIRNCYGRESEVVYPPVNTSFYVPRNGPGDYFLMVTAMAPYKRVDLAVRAFNRLKLPLKIIGTGQMASRLREIAGPNIEFLGWRSDEEVRDAYAGCRAFIFPGVEDFGITPLEAQSCGRPVIALGRGGALETVAPVNPEGTAGVPARQATGVFFYEQDERALEEAVMVFLRIEKDFQQDAIRRNALKFDRTEFKKSMEKHLKDFVI